MKVTKKMMKEVEENHKKILNELAEKYLTENPITHPLGDYIKKVFTDAYIMGEEIVDFY